MIITPSYRRTSGPPEVPGVRASYEVRILLDPLRESTGHESIPHTLDVEALETLALARSILSGDSSGIGIVISRDGEPVYEWLDVPGCFSHTDTRLQRADVLAASTDVFDLLSSDATFLRGLGHRPGGYCDASCRRTCDIDHQDLGEALESAERRLLTLYRAHIVRMIEETLRRR